MCLFIYFYFYFFSFLTLPYAWTCHHPLRTDMLPDVVWLGIGHAAYLIICPFLSRYTSVDKIRRGEAVLLVSSSLNVRPSCDSVFREIDAPHRPELCLMRLLNDKVSVFTSMLYLVGPYPDVPAVSPRRALHFRVFTCLCCYKTCPACDFSLLYPASGVTVESFYGGRKTAV